MAPTMTRLLGVLHPLGPELRRDQTILLRLEERYLVPNFKQLLTFLMQLRKGT
jgi:hypothetical protein